MTYTEEQKIEAKKMYLGGCKVSEIEEQLNINRRTLYHWIKIELWGEQLTGQSTLYVANRRLQLLLDREGKNEQEFKEMEFLVSAIDRLSRMEERKKKQVEFSIDHEGGQGASGSRSKKKKKSNKNDFSDITEEEVMQHFKKGLFAYQLELWEAIEERTRQILKSRQIGLTFYFAREAFANALLTGENQVFLSASRAQSDIFREYIKGYAQEWFGVELTGKDKIEIITPKGTATLYFLSTNSTTAQGYHGHVYVDEYFWIPNFEKLNKLASAMAAHKKWRKTYFSTPSAKSHGAYGFWSGDNFNKRQQQQKKAQIPMLAEEELRQGGRWEAGDKCWRRVITLLDAQAKGCDLFDIEQLKLEYTPQEFRQLFLCEFIDDSGSVFKLADLEKCLSDETTWPGFRPAAAQPYAGPVWIGYDPSRTVDGASIVVLSAPASIRGKFRVLEKITMQNELWNTQAETIRELTKKYKVEYIGIDVTGNGSGVFEMVQQFFPQATAITYGLQSKTELVLKAQQVVDSGRILWDAKHSDIAASFMQIKRAATGSGAITYYAERSKDTGHADAAWAIMHALNNEGLLTPFQGEEGSGCEVSFS